MVAVAGAGFPWKQMAFELECCFAMSRRLLRTGEECNSPPGQELLGVLISPWALPRVLQLIPKIKKVGGSD
jgi:hypothetical protein